jgi:predicted acyl esterase
MHTVPRALVALLTLALLVPVSAGAAEAPGNEHVTAPAYIPTSDPTITLYADVMRPKNAPADAKLPVILSIGPYFNHSGSTILDYDPTAPGAPNARFDDLITGARIFEKGYALVYVDLPGFGASSGCNDFGGPAEQLASKTAVEWAAAQPWSNGKVGMWGKSYDGWTQVMAMAGHPKGLAAAVIQSPIIDGYRTLYMNGLHYYASPTGWYATPAVYQAGDAQPPTLDEEPDYYANWAKGEIVACYALNIAEQDGFIDKDDPAGFWAARDIVAEAGKDDAAVLWSHGFLDENTKPDNFVDVWKNLKGPHRAWFGQYHHVRGNELDQVGRVVTSKPKENPFFDEAMRWFDEHLKGNAGAAAGDPPVEVADSDGKWRVESQWPPADAVTKTMPLKNGSYTDAEGNTAAAPSGGVWTFTQPMAADTRISGVPKLSVTATTQSPRAALVALLYDVAADGKAKLISRGGSAIRASGPLSFELYPQDYRVAAGHRIGLIIAGNDDPWVKTVHSQQPVDISAAKLALPVLSNPRTTFITTARKTPAMAAVPAPTIPVATITANELNAPDFG